MGRGYCKVLLPLIIGYIVYVGLEITGHLFDIRDIGNFDCKYLNSDIIGPEDVIQYKPDIFITGSIHFFELFEGKFPQYGPHNSPDGALFAIFPQTGTTKQIELVGYPENTKFNPHGLYLDVISCGSQHPESPVQLRIS